MLFGKKKKKPFQMSKYKLTLVLSHYCQQWLKSSKLVVNSSNIYWFSTDATSNYWLYKSILNFLLSPNPWPSVIYYQITYLYFRSVPQAEKKKGKKQKQRVCNCKTEGAPIVRLREVEFAIEVIVISMITVLTTYYSHGCLW